MNSRLEIVPVGELRISADTETVLVTVTGSCVALALYDAEKRMAGMLHVVLPGRRSVRRKGDRKSFFADTGTPLLVEEMIRSGARRKNLKATVAGGASLLSNGTNIGLRNVKAVTALLEKEGIPIVMKHIGGKIGRRVTLPVATGQAKVEPILSKQRIRSPVPCERERSLPSGHLKMILSELAALKPCPGHSERLIKAVHDAAIDWEEVSRIVSRCVILTMHIFRIANSPYYGRPGKISSFRQALTVLGTRQLRRICILASVTRKSESQFDYSEISGTMLSRHCLASAVIARYLATAMPLQFQEDVFTTGLLHGIGNLSLMILNSLSRTESVEWDMSGSELGGLVLSAWKMPEHIITAISSYESPGPAHKIQPMAAFVHAGCGISRLLEITPTAEPGEFKFSSDVLEKIGLKNGLAGILPGVFRELELRNLMLDI
ncbi:HDOD domain-containing protein [Desulfobacterales bacterium HSG2]|nr:HDOD domain-containing protein [Desulfobacterales bacterium HSG2]